MDGRPSPGALARAPEFEDSQRLANAPQFDRAEFAQFEARVEQLGRRLAQVDAPGRRGLLDARGDPGGTPLGGEGGSDRTVDDVAGVQSHADPEGDPVGAADLLGKHGDLAGEVQCGEASEDGVVLERDRSAEMGLDPLAGEPVDHASVAADAVA